MDFLPFAPGLVSTTWKYPAEYLPSVHSLPAEEFLEKPFLPVLRQETLMLFLRNSPGIILWKVQGGEACAAVQENFRSKNCENSVTRKAWGSKAPRS